MYDVRLINMPFANLHIPGLGLTQLRAAVRSRFGGDVATSIHYFNHDFAHFFGLKRYREISALGEHQNSGIGDWFFRQAAFPELEGNFDEYFFRYYPSPTPESRHFKMYVAEKRARLDSFLDHLIDEYELERADLVGLTTMFQQSVACFALARRLKDRKSDVVVAIGGANCETPMGQEMARGVPQVDYVFSGPGLRNFPQLIQYLRDGDVARTHRIHGVFTKENVDRVVDEAELAGNGTATLPPGAVFPRGPELDINVDLELDFDSFFEDIGRSFPHGEVEPVLPFETSRGCWWGERAHCTFCGLNGSTMSYRSMRPDKALALLRSLFRRYDHLSKQYICVDNIMPRSYLTEVFPYLEPPPGTTIFYEVKADLEDEDIAVLGRAGVTVVQPGIESLATSTLKLMKKGVSSFRNIGFLQSCLRHGVYPTWNLLVGFPRETSAVFEKYAADIPRLAHLPPPTGVYPVRFDRYSPYFNEADEYGLDLAPLDFYHLTYPFDDAALRNLAYYFFDRNYDAEYFGEMVAWLDRLQRLVLAWQVRWHGRRQPVRPRLHIQERDGRFSVVDTRSGEEEEHPLDDGDHKLLVRLLEPQRLDRLGGDADVAERLARFRRHGWLFEEGDRAVAVVLPDPPPPRTKVTSPVADVNLDVDVNDLLLSVDPAVATAEVGERGQPELVSVSREERRISRTTLADHSSERTRGDRG